MKKILCLVLALAMVLSLVACGGSSTTAESSESTETTEAAAETATEATTEATDAGVLKIGGIGPLTGAAAVYGNAMKNGAELAVEEINAQGGLQIELNFQDDEHDAEKSVNAYNQLKDWGMQVVFGPTTSTPAVAVAAEAANDGYFLLTGSASAVAVPETGDTIFQLCFTDPNQGIASADYISENNLATKIGVLYDSSDVYSSGIYEKFVARAEELGLDVVDTEAFTADSKTDFSTQLQKLQAAGADLVFLPFYYTEAAIVLQQAKDMDYAPVFFGCDGMDGILDLDNFDKSLAEGLMLLTPFSADATDEKTVNFVTKFKDTYGDTPSQFAADGYDCIYAIYQAAVDGGVTADMAAEDATPIFVEQFTTMSVDGVTGEGMTWAADGTVSKSPKAVVITDGVYVGA